MQLEALVLLEDSPDARKLVATWAAIGERYDGDDDNAEMIEAWERVSGVHAPDIERLEPILFANGIISTGGIVDPEAQRYLRAHVAQTLQRQSRPQPRR